MTAKQAAEAKPELGQWDDVFSEFADTEFDNDVGIDAQEECAADYYNRMNDVHDEDEVEGEADCGEEAAEVDEVEEEAPPQNRRKFWDPAFVKEKRQEFQETGKHPWHIKTSHHSRKLRKDGGFVGKADLDFEDFVMLRFEDNAAKRYGTRAPERGPPPGPTPANRGFHRRQAWREGSRGGKNAEFYAWMAASGNLATVLRRSNSISLSAYVITIIS